MIYSVPDGLPGYIGGQEIGDLYLTLEQLAELPIVSCVRVALEGQRFGEKNLKPVLESNKLVEDVSRFVVCHPKRRFCAVMQDSKMTGSPKRVMSMISRLRRSVRLSCVSSCFRRPISSAVCVSSHAAVSFAVMSKFTRIFQFSVTSVMRLVKGVGEGAV